MGQALAIDTLAYAKRLINAGMPEQQAEVQAQILAEVIDSNLATKADIARVKADIANVKAELELKIEQIKADLIKWIMGMLIAQSAVIVGLMQILK